MNDMQSKDEKAYASVEFFLAGKTMDNCDEVWRWYDITAGNIETDGDDVDDIPWLLAKHQFSVVV